MEDKAVRMHNKKIFTNSILVTNAAVSRFFPPDHRRSDFYISFMNSVQPQ